MKTCAHSVRDRREAFTLVELLVVIGIIALLVGLIFPAVQKGRKATDVHRAEVEVHALAVALKAYYAEYNRWPVGNSEEGAIPKKMVRALTGEHDPSNGVTNWRKRVFMEVSGLTVASTNLTFNDPWGTPYRCALDSDFSGFVSAPHDDDSVLTGPFPGNDVVVWSKGPNKKTNNPVDSNYDDIRSW